MSKTKLSDAQKLAVKTTSANHPSETRERDLENLKKALAVKPLKPPRRKQ